MLPSLVALYTFSPLKYLNVFYTIPRLNCKSLSQANNLASIVCMKDNLKVLACRKYSRRWWRFIDSWIYITHYFPFNHVNDVGMRHSAQGKYVFWCVMMEKLNCHALICNSISNGAHTWIHLKPLIWLPPHHLHSSDTSLTLYSMNNKVINCFNPLPTGTRCSMY